MSKYNINYEDEDVEDNETLEDEFLKDMTETCRFCLSIGSKGSSKTYTMMSALRYFLFFNCFERYHFVCPCYKGEMMGSYDFLKDQKHVFIYSSYSEAVAKRVEKDRQKFKTLFLIDDGTAELINNMDNTLTKLITTTRHYCGCSIWMCIHGARKVLSVIVRSNCDWLFLYRVNAKLLEVIYEEYLTYNYEHFRQFRAEYVEIMKQKYSGILISNNESRIDTNVKNWEINSEYFQTVKLKPTQPIVTKKKQEEKQQNRLFNSIQFKVGRSKNSVKFNL